MVVVVEQTQQAESCEYIENISRLALQNTNALETNDGWGENIINLEPQPTGCRGSNQTPHHLLLDQTYLTQTQLEIQQGHHRSENFKSVYTVIDPKRSSYLHRIHSNEKQRPMNPSSDRYMAPIFKPYGVA